MLIISRIKLIRRNSKSRKEKQFKQWVENGKPVPPPHVVKQKVIEEYSRKYNLKTLIETGTYLGDMVFSQRKNFEKIISIELSPELYYQTKNTLKFIENAEIYLGDSSKILKEISDLGLLEQPSLFWLDGHYSAGITALGNKETPILEELSVILGSQYNHIILIDDARCFIGTNDYPSLNELRIFINRKKAGYTVSIQDDIIILTYERNS